MNKPIGDLSVIVSDESFQSDDPYDIIYSNICFINGLKEQFFRDEELAADAMKSYYVDYYVGEVNNGGFSQFVYNSNWEAGLVDYVRQGLRAMKAVRHLELFDKSAAIIDQIGPDGMDQFFESEYFGENAERDTLNSFDDTFYDLNEEEDLIQINAQWLRGLPNLVVISQDEMQAEIERRAAALPDREARAADALANEPEFMKLIRALCAASNQVLDRVTAGDPTHNHQGQPTLAWHFITDRGHHYMIESEGQAIMFHGKTHAVVAQLDASP